MVECIGQDEVAVMANDRYQSRVGDPAGSIGDGLPKAEEIGLCLFQGKVAAKLKYIKHTEKVPAP